MHAVATHTVGIAKQNVALGGASFVDLRFCSLIGENNDCGGGKPHLSLVEKRCSMFQVRDHLVTWEQPRVMTWHLLQR